MAMNAAAAVAGLNRCLEKPKCLARMYLQYGWRQLYLLQTWSRDEQRVRPGDGPFTLTSRGIFACLLNVPILLLVSRLMNRLMCEELSSRPFTREGLAG